MNQPPDDSFYNTSTENTPFPPQQRPAQAPGYPQRPQAAPNNYPPQQNFPPQSFMGQPGPQNFPPQGPLSQPGLERPDANYRRPVEQPGPGQLRPPNYPPPSGPISRPGFSPVSNVQQDRYPMQSPPQPGDSPQAGGPASPWEAQQFSQQQAAPSANWPNTAQPTKPTGFKQSRLWLAIILVLLALIVIGGGTFVLFSHNGNNAATTSATQGTPTTNGVTPITTQSTGKTPTASLNSVGTPVQAGTDWVVTVTSAKSTSSSLIPPNAGSTYLEINLTLKNVSGKSLTLVSVLQFPLADATGHRYNETAADTNIRRPPDGNVNSNATLAAQIAYEVPTSQHTFTLTFAYGLENGSNASVSWRITI